MQMLYPSRELWTSEETSSKRAAWVDVGPKTRSNENAAFLVFLAPETLSDAVLMLRAFAQPGGGRRRDGG